MVRNMCLYAQYTYVLIIRSVNIENVRIWGKMIRNMSYTRGYTNVRIKLYLRRQKWNSLIMNDI
jgi:hypothetical protein